MRLSPRPPAVAGFFYEGTAGRLRHAVDGYLVGQETRHPADAWRALLLPHAGHVYSGPVCGAGVAAVEWPRLVLLLGPNHRGMGSAAALSRAPTWETPLGAIPTDTTLVDALLRSCADVEADDRAHASEHSIEVILPFLQAARPDVSIACLSISEPSLDLCLRVGRGVAAVIREREAAGERVAIVVSSDLNHYLSRVRNRQKDDRAIDALLRGDPVELFERVLVREGISMCGILPATALLEALRHLGAHQAALLAHGDSADASGDEDRVVGYAAVLWTRAEGKLPA